MSLICIGSISNVKLRSTGEIGTWKESGKVEGYRKCQRERDLEALESLLKTAGLVLHRRLERVGRVESALSLGRMQSVVEKYLEKNSERIREAFDCE